MSQPQHISEIMLKIAADSNDQFGKVLRRCPFIQAELIHRTSGEDQASSIKDKAKPYRGAKALDSLSGACERQRVAAAATRPKGIESVAIKRRTDFHIGTDGHSV